MYTHSSKKKGVNDSAVSVEFLEVSKIKKGAA
jgi:hypothetical protein